MATAMNQGTGASVQQVLSDSNKLRDSQFGLEDAVDIGIGEISGRIKGISVYAESEGTKPQYMVKFIDRQTGIPRTEWFSQNDLSLKIED